MTNSPELLFTSFGEDFILTFEVTAYANGRTAIQVLYFDEEMECNAPFAKITTNMPEVHLNEGEVLIKDWSENEPLVAHLVNIGWLTSTGREVISGFVAPAVMRPAGPLLDFIEGR
jgi:hypothetical protein